MKENHQISNNWYFIIIKNLSTYQMVYWTITNQLSFHSNQLSFHSNNKWLLYKFLLTIIINELTPIKPLFSLYYLKTRTQSTFFQPILLYQSTSNILHHFSTTLYLSQGPQPGPRSNVKSNQIQTGIFQEISNKWKLSCKILKCRSL